MRATRCGLSECEHMYVGQHSKPASVCTYVSEVLEGECVFSQTGVEGSNIVTVCLAFLLLFPWRSGISSSILLASSFASDYLVQKPVTRLFFLVKFPSWRSSAHGDLLQSADVSLPALSSPDSHPALRASRASAGCYVCLPCLLDTSSATRRSLRHPTR